MPAVTWPATHCPTQLALEARGPHLGNATFRDAGGDGALQGAVREEREN